LIRPSGPGWIAGWRAAGDGHEIFRRLINIDLVGCDVMQIIPCYDPNGWYATLAASVAYKAVSLVALRWLKCEMEAR
jgi:arginase family enzyme